MKEYIDLGLPSGALWASENEYGYYTYDEAVELFEDNLPTKEQWDELKNECQWEWKWKWDGTNSGCTLTGSNGNSIFLPADGFLSIKKNKYFDNMDGYYWSSTPHNLYHAECFCLQCYNALVKNDVGKRLNSSVRLVKPKL